MKNLFFYKLYLFDKRLFSLTALFSALTILFNIKGDEITPFFIWAMYSEKENSINKYEVYKIQINDSTLFDYSAGYTDNNRFFLSSTINYYNQIKQNNDTDPTLSLLKKKSGSLYKVIKPLVEILTNSKSEMEQFPGWYKRYLEQTTGREIYKLKVFVLNTHFTEKYQLKTDSSYLLAAWSQP